MLAAAGYKTKKDLKESVGKRLRYEETSAFGLEFKATGKNALVGPGAYDRKWYVTVTTVDGVITKVE